MDPAALGTLHIGLDAERPEVVSRAPPPTRSGASTHSALPGPCPPTPTALRTLADRLEQPTTQAAPS